MLASCSGAFTINCSVTNFSMSGARVRVDSGSLIFGKILLVHLREKLAFDTKIAWRNERDIGLEFTQAHDLDRATKAELKMLRRYCVDHEPALITVTHDRAAAPTGAARPTFGCRQKVARKAA
jgi:hypothetical protein